MESESVHSEAAVTATRGRRHVEPAADAADPFALDRRRVLASTSFRRLQYKTQVFVTDEHDHFRTRLTHTLEVAELSRRLARALGLNETLAEVAALAHDLGHPPFGHAGEAELAERMKAHGGFEHNAQTLRVVDFLEHPFPEFRGLNLTYEVREAVAKHETVFDRPDAAQMSADASELFESGRHPSLEGQIVSIADRFAYGCHDIEDAIGAGLLDARDLDALSLWKQSARCMPDMDSVSKLGALRRPILNDIEDRLIAAVVDATRANPRVRELRSPDDARRAEWPAVVVSNDAVGALEELEAFMRKRVYRHPTVIRVDDEARATVGCLFEAYVEDPSRMPPRFASRIDGQGRERVVCDFLAGMTDRYCRSECDRLRR